MLLAPGAIHPVIGLIAIIAISVGAGASGALNMWYDADIDQNMARTAARPIPRGRVTPDEALQFGGVLSVMSVLTLGVLVNWVAGALLAMTIFYYLFIYTMWLKRLTPQNIVVGGAAGAFPSHDWLGGGHRHREHGKHPAVPHHFHVDAPSFLVAGAAQVARLRACRRADAAGGRRSGRDARSRFCFIRIVLVPLAILPAFIGLGGITYGAASIVLGAVFLWFAFDVWRITEGREADKACKRLFWFSILYLYALFAILVVEGVMNRLLA